MNRTRLRIGVGVRESPNTPTQAVRSGNWKLLLDGERAMLFDLRTDIGERENLIGQRSDVARRLGPLLAAWQEDVDAEAKGVASR